MTDHPENQTTPAPFENHRAETAFIHETSYVDSPCRIGEHTAILHFSRVLSHSIIGDYCRIGHNVTIASGVYLGNEVHVLHNAILNSGVVMENQVYCGPSVVVTENAKVRKRPGAISPISPTVFRHGSHVGANTTVASGHVIGRYAFVEAGTVIDRNIPDFAIVYGNPIQFSGWQCECGHMLKNSEEDDKPFKCGACGNPYVQTAKWKLVRLPDKDEQQDISKSEKQA